MPIRITCPSCGRSGRVPDNAIGRIVQCPACQFRYQLTAEVAASDDLELLDDDAPPPPASPRRSPERDPSPPVREKRPGRPAGASGSGTSTPSDGPKTPIPAGLAIPVGVLAGLLFTGFTAYQVVTRLAGGGSPPPASFVADRGPAPVSSNPASPSSTAAEPDFAAQARVAAAGSSSRDDGGGRTLATADIVAESEPSIALIRGKSSSGTGFLVAPGLLATNAHVVDDEFIENLEIRFPSAAEGRKGPAAAELLYEDPERDLALLAVKTPLAPLRVAKNYNFRKGEDITVIGNPGLGGELVLENAISRGVMSTKATLDGHSFYQLGVAINPGNSGGPVFDSSGRVIGVATLKTSKQEALAFCIPVEDLQAALTKLGGQSADVSAKVRSRHRVVNAVKGLGSGGAIYCLGIDLRRVGTLSTDGDVKQLVQKFEGVVADLDKGVFSTLSPQMPAVRSDPLVTASVKTGLGQMSENFALLHDLYSRSPNGASGGEFLQMKRTHRRLVTELSTTLGLETPSELLALFDERADPTPSLVMGFGPSAPGSLRQRLLERHGLIAGPGGFARPPGAPPSLRDRMGPRRGPRIGGFGPR